MFHSYVKLPEGMMFFLHRNMWFYLSTWRITPPRNWSASLPLRHPRFDAKTGRKAYTASYSGGLLLGTPETSSSAQNLSVPTICRTFLGQLYGFRKKMVATKGTEEFPRPLGISSEPGGIPVSAGSRGRFDQDLLLGVRSGRWAR